VGVGVGRWIVWIVMAGDVVDSGDIQETSRIGILGSPRTSQVRSHSETRGHRTCSFNLIEQVLVYHPLVRYMYY
jgi:hypothetical protein